MQTVGQHSCKGKRAYFLSDAHLGAGYIVDARRHEQTLVSFLDSIKDDCCELYLLGDILDFWYEYGRVIPRGYVRFFGKLAELSDMGVSIFWMLGNHEVYIGKHIAEGIGLTVLDGKCVHEVLGKRFLLSHGDDLAEMRFSYKLMKWCFRSKVCRFLFELLPPSFTVKFGLGWSRSNRKKHYLTEEVLRKVKSMAYAGIEKFCVEHSDVKYVVFGHLHCVESVTLVNDVRVAILGDWISKNSYAVFDGNTLEMKYYDAACV